MYADRASGDAKPSVAKAPTATSNPWPSLPNTQFAGKRTSWNRMRAWSEPRWPRPRPGIGLRSRPGVEAGTRKAVMPASPREKTIATSATPPLVIQCFSPLMTQSSP